MRKSGVIEYITPRQIATESSTVPKSVMKTTVGGALVRGAWADSVLERPSTTSSSTNTTDEYTGAYLGIRREDIF